MKALLRTQLEALGLTAECADVLRHLWDYLDEQITRDGAERLRTHIASCEQCRGYEAYQACFLEAVAKLRGTMAAPETLRERLADSLKGQGCGCWQRVKE